MLIFRAVYLMSLMAPKLNSIHICFCSDTIVSFTNTFGKNTCLTVSLALTAKKFLTDSSQMKRGTCGPHVSGDILQDWEFEAHKFAADFPKKETGGAFSMTLTLINKC